MAKKQQPHLLTSLTLQWDDDAMRFREPSKQLKVNRFSDPEISFVSMTWCYLAIRPLSLSLSQSQHLSVGSLRTAFEKFCSLKWNWMYTEEQFRRNERHKWTQVLVPIRIILEHVVSFATIRTWESSYCGQSNESVNAGYLYRIDVSLNRSLRCNLSREVSRHFSIEEYKQFLLKEKCFIFTNRQHLTFQEFLLFIYMKFMFCDWQISNPNN